MTLPLLLALPWVGVALAFLLLVRVPRALPASDEADASLGDHPPLVSVIIPSRNEAHNIGRVVASVTASTYPRFEVLVVDDGSADGTGTVARAVPGGNAERYEVIDGEPLPEGWLGKPWACAQGARRARGGLLLFIDADTTHGEALLARAVSGLEQDRADVLTLLGRQLMVSFWERLVQPQIFVLIGWRFPDPRRPPRPARWRGAIANGQFMLFRRSVYEALGGHAAVQAEVVEDLRLAQLLVRGGWRLTLRGAEDALSTRMYRDLGEIVRGWSKNVALGALQTVPPWTRPVVLPAALLFGVTLWILPPAVLLAALAGAGGAGLLTWAVAAVSVSAIFWCAATARMGASFVYGLLYPVGASVGAWIVLRSWLRGRRVEWKGREYRVERPS